jgi:DNA repair exonuclease SbcCD nuclease subunit
MRLVHAADLHLDSPLRGLGRLGDDGVAETLRAASRRALENLVALVVDEKVPVLLLAGDVYDGDWHDYGTGRFFVRQMDRLHDEGIRVVMISGNHDAESEITRSLRLPPNVTVLDVARPQSVRFDDFGIVVHGQGFATKAVLHNLAAAFPDRIPGVINVGLLHTSVAGQEGHEPYAPCDLQDLLAKGYDYFALGHVHRRVVLHEGEHTVAYSGNLQGRSPRETGPKGALLVDLEPGLGLEPGHVTLDFHTLDVARWETLTVPVEGCTDLEAALDVAQERMRAVAATAQGRPVAARVVFTGRTPAAADLADTERVREELRLIADRTGVTVEKVEVRVRSDAEDDAIDPGLLAEIRSAVSVRAGDQRLLKDTLRTLDREVGRLLREAGLTDLSDPSVLSGVLSRAADSLAAQLAGGAK